MEVVNVKHQIKAHTLDNFYIFTGDEITAQSIYVNKIAEVTNATLQRLDSVVEIYKNKRGKSFIVNKRCFVVRDDKEFMKNEDSWDTIKTIIGDNILIFLATQIDKRGKFYKHFKDDIVSFNHFEIPMLVRYIQKEIDLSDDNASRLAEICECDYGRILLEIDKIKAWVADYSKDKSMAMPYDNALLRLINNGTIYQPPSDVAIDFVNAVLARNYQRSFKLLSVCKENENPVLGLQALLYNQFKHLLQVQSCDSKDISKSTGLSSWEIKIVSDYVGRYRTGELVYAIKLLRSIERGIKVGDIDSEIAIDYFLVNIL